MADSIVEKPSLKARQWQLREDAILDEAGALLAEKGFTATTLEDVIAAVGISKTTLYQHFASKEELAIAILRREIARSQAHLGDLEKSLPPRETLAAMIAWTVERRFGAGMPCRFDITGVLSETAQESLRTDELALVASLESLFTKAREEGTVRVGIPPILSAQCLLSVLKDWNYAGLLGGRRLNLAALESGLIDLLLK